MCEKKYVDLDDFSSIKNVHFRIITQLDTI